MAPKRATTAAKKAKGKATRGGKKTASEGRITKEDKGGKKAAEILGRLATEFGVRMAAAREAAREAEEEVVAGVLSGVEGVVAMLGGEEAEGEAEEDGEHVAALVGMLEGIYGTTREVVASLMGTGVVFFEPRARRYEFVQRWMPHVYDTDDEGYKAHALVSLISMTWVRQHLGHGPFGPQKGDVLPYFVFVESFLSETPDPAPYKAWVKHTLSLLDKQQPSLVTKMLDNRAAQIYAAITEVLTAVTSLKLTDDDKNDIATIADQATALSNELWKSPTAWRLIPMGLNLSEKDNCPTFRNETHMALDVEDGVELPYNTPMHGVVFPGLTEVKLVDGKVHLTAKAKVKVICTEPEGKEDGESAGEQSSTSPKKTPGKTPEESLEGKPKKDARTNPEQAPERTPERTPERVPRGTPVIAPEKTPESTPEGAPEKSPRRSPKKTPTGT